MVNITILEWAGLAALCTLAATISATWLTGRTAATNRSDRMHPFAFDSSAVWLFEGTSLLDSSSSAKAQFRGVDVWDDLRGLLRNRFPDFPDSPQDVATNRSAFCQSRIGSDESFIKCESLDGMTRIELCSGTSASAVTSLRAEHSHQQEQEKLLTAINKAPYPIWRLGEDGDVAWHNTAYATLFKQVKGTEPQRFKPLFSDWDNTRPLGKKTRMSVTIKGNEHKLWFDVSAVKQDAGTLCIAVDINAVVDAEIAQRNFVQTLAKTFAQLSIGLAIFDRNRQLALFNPALIDLTSLSADFLSGRPNLLSFFDRLRDQKMMPEPKNYVSWRHQMADLVAAAADGRYQETWSLPSGSVYSVTGRPHPDGAVAFLFEDITAEITLTRRFRSDLEMGQSILDHVGEAIAVFSPTGALTVTNSAYCSLWNADPDRSFARSTIQDAIRLWQNQCAANPFWGELRDFAVSAENRVEWSAKVVHESGETILCHVHPIQHGATMICFRYAAPDTPGLGTSVSDGLVNA
jgi:PAS domain-containing protein